LFVLSAEDQWKTSLIQDITFDNCLCFPAMMKISTFCPNIADDRFISSLISKIGGLKIHGLKIDVYLFPRMKYNSVI
jgi:hypothetical protein